MRSPPALDVLVITWNARDKLARCLHSVCAHPPHARMSVLVVDNGSCDGTLAMLARRFPRVRVIANDRNRGVAGARNQGLAGVTGDFILLLDDDAEVLEGSLDELLTVMTLKRLAGVVGARLLFPDSTLQYSCKRFPDISAPILNRLVFLPGVREATPLRRHLMVDFDHCALRPVDYVIGACQLIRTAALREVGPLDARIFYGPEDIDFCARMWLAGWQVWYAPDAKVIHHQQRLTKQNMLSLLAWRHLRGLGYWFRKYRSNERRRLTQLVEHAQTRASC